MAELVLSPVDEIRAGLDDQKTIRELLVESVVAQIRDGLTSAKVTRGFVGAEVSIFPSVWIFEGDEKVEYSSTKRRGLYIKTLPLLIEYMKKTSRGDDVYILGNAMLGEIAQVVERDEYFIVPECQNRLVIEYYMASNAIVQIGDNVVDAVAEYRFVYVDQHLGIPRR